MRARKIPRVLLMVNHKLCKWPAQQLGLVALKWLKIGRNIEIFYGILPQPVHHLSIYSIDVGIGETRRPSPRRREGDKIVDIGPVSPHPSDPLCAGIAQRHEQSREHQKCCNSSLYHISLLYFKT